MNKVIEKIHIYKRFYSFVLMNKQKKINFSTTLIILVYRQSFSFMAITESCNFKSI